MQSFRNSIKSPRAMNQARFTLMRIYLFVFVFVFPAVVAAAGGVSGKVINKTTGKPAAADQVILIDLSADRKEGGRTRTDAAGYFHFHVARQGVPWLIKVVHADVLYEATTSGVDRPPEIEVFDKTGASDEVRSGIQVIRLEADAGSLRTTEMFTLVNASNPPRTIQKEELFSISLPPGATLLSSLAEGPGGAVVKSIAVTPPNENRCYFNFPLRPGTTKIQLEYQAPYSGSLTLIPHIPFPADMFGVVLPATMQFESSQPGVYTRQPDEEGGIVELIRGVPGGNAPTFTISGAGPALVKNNDRLTTLQEYMHSQNPTPVTAADNQPAGLTGSLTRSQILWIGFLAFIIMAGLGMFSYQGYAKLHPVSVSGNAAKSEEAIREQLFSLELDRLQNRISKSHYATARSALEKRLVAALSKPAKL